MEKYLRSKKIAAIVMFCAFIHLRSTFLNTGKGNKCSFLKSLSMTELLPDVIRVLLIEDDDIDAQDFRRMLRNNPDVTFEIGHVLRLGDAIEKLSTGDFDLCVLDLMLPDGSQLDSIEQIRTLDGRIPIVVMTGVDDEKVAMSAITLGAQDYIPKGELTRQQVLRSLKMAVARQRKACGIGASANFDQLTHLPNSRSLHAKFAELQSCSTYNSLPMSFAMLDLDHLSQINEEHGYLVGDAVLRAFAELLSMLRRDDIWVARFGGQQFIALMPNHTLDQANTKMSDLQRRLASAEMAFSDDCKFRATASSGVVAVESESLEETFNLCCMALQKSKEAA